MISVQVKGLDQLTKNINALSRQLPFAVSKALNETGKIIQRKVTQELLPRDFILAGHQRPARGAPWWKPGTALGFNLKFSKKSQGENMQTVLGSRAEWLALQETGGTKRAQGGRVAVPFGARKSITDIIPRGRRPRRLMERRKAFILRLRSGLDAMYERTGKKGGGLRLLYILEPAVHLRPRLNFVKFTTEEAGKLIGPIFNQELGKALASAK
jgi:hypothetical protein